MKITPWAWIMWVERWKDYIAWVESIERLISGIRGICPNWKPHGYSWIQAFSGHEGRNGKEYGIQRCLWIQHIPPCWITKTRNCLSICICHGKICNMVRLERRLLMLVVVARCWSRLPADNAVSPNITSVPFPHVGLLVCVTSDITLALVPQDMK